MASLLSLRSVSFRYRADQPWILREVDFDLFEGDCVQVRGESGGGKSTLLRLMNRLSEPGSGCIDFHAEPLAGISPPLLRTRIVLVPQEAVMLPGTIEYNLTFPFAFGALRGRPRPERARLQQMLDDFRLGRMALDADATQLSVGQRMRLAVIRALLLRPVILLLDEPVAGLDAESRRTLEDKVVELNEREAMTVVIVSHAPMAAGSPRLRPCVLEEGKLVCEATPWS